MFSQLFNITEFRNNISALVLGDFLNIDNPVWLDDLFEEIAVQYDIPVISGFKFTHGTDKLTVPIGEYASVIDGELLINSRC